MLKNAIVYIDGFNLYYRLKGTKYKWLNPLELCLQILPTDKFNIVEVKFFTAKIKRNQKDPQNLTRQMIYWRALQTIPNLSVILGKYKIKTARGKLIDRHQNVTTKIRAVQTFEEKESDVNIAINMVSDAYEGKFDQAILISNDTDLVPPMKLVKQHLKKKIWVISPANHNVHADIARWSNKCTVITDNHLQKSQFPVEIEDHKGIIRKPKNW